MNTFIHELDIPCKIEVFETMIDKLEQLANSYNRMRLFEKVPLLDKLLEQVISDSSLAN